MKKLITLAMGMFLFSIAAAPVMGAIFPHVQIGLNRLEDNDYESFVDNNGNGLIDVGDQFVGAMVIQGINGNGTAAAGVPTISAVFAIEATNIVGAAGSATQIDFGPLSGGAAAWAGLPNPPNTGLPVPVSNFTTIVMYNDSDYASNVPTGGTGAFIGDGSIIAEFGDLGAPDFWRTTGPAGIDDPANVLALNALNEFSQAVTFNPTGLLAPHNALFPGPGGIQGSGTFVTPVQQPPSIFGLSTDTDVIINVIPEPMTFFVWGGLGLCVCVASLSRKRKR